MTTSLRFPLWLAVSVVIVAGIGLLDSFYLALQHYIGFPTVCLVANGCDTILTSSYATLFGVPTALFGVLYYAAMLLLALRAIETKRLVFLATLSFASVFGLLASAWFVYLQLVVLRAICLYCMVSAASSFVLFGLGAWFIINHFYVRHE